MDQGRKIFFLYPHHFIKDLIVDIIKNEYEAYLVDDHVKMLELIRIYPESLLFINLDETLKEPEWENYIKTIQITPELKDVSIGIMTHFHIEQNISEKYVNNLGIKCGFIKIGTDINKCREQILKIIEANNPKGCRKYIRAFCNPSLDKFNIMTSTTKQEGSILDLSIAGMAITFDNKNFNLEVNTKLSNIQIKLRGIICSVTGLIRYKRELENNSTIYIIMFDQKSLPPLVKEKIHTFICHCLQDTIKQWLESLVHKNPPGYSDHDHDHQHGEEHKQKAS